MVLGAGGLAVWGRGGEQAALRGRCVALVDGEGAQHEVAQRGRRAGYRALAQPGGACRLPVGQQQAHRRQQAPFLLVRRGAERPGPQQVGGRQRHGALLQLPEGSRLDVAGQAVIDLVGGRYPVRERGTCIKDLGGGVVQGLAAGGRQVLVHRGAVQRMRELCGYPVVHGSGAAVTCDMCGRFCCEDHHRRHPAYAHHDLTVTQPDGDPTE